MKKIYATLFACGALTTLQAQVIMNVEQPIDLAGTYTVSWPAPSDGWGFPDLADPANAVTGTLAIVDDGTADDSLGCGALVNGADISGKIAVVYRGVCEFGHKALQAQNAGAIACVIINNAPGSAVVPGAGADGASVTIPTVMISQLDGATLHDGIRAGTVVAFIGSIIGLNTNDVGFFNSNVWLPTYTAKPQTLCGDATEFNFRLGVWLFNYGTDPQSGVTVTADVSQSGSSVFSVTSPGVALNGSGDSIFVDLGEFSLPSYSGYYTLTYSAATNGPTDEFTANNQYSTSFDIGSLISYAPIDENTHLPSATGAVQPASATTGFMLCTHFQDPHASRIGASGMYFSMSPAVSGTPILGELVTLDIFEWQDDFTGLSDAPTTPTLESIWTADYEFTEEVPGQLVFQPINPGIPLQDDMRYLACVTTFSADWRLGYTETLKYGLTQDSTDKIFTCVQNGASFFPGGFVGAGVPTISLATVPVATIGITENATTQQAEAFPNPASSELRIPISSVETGTVLQIFDMNSKLVSTKAVDIHEGAMVVNVKDVPAGTYNFSLLSKTGVAKTFKVVISR